MQELKLSESQIQDQSIPPNLLALDSPEMRLQITQKASQINGAKMQYLE